MKIDKEINISNAQIEVWEMKESIYKKVENLSIKEALYKIMESSQIAKDEFLNSVQLKQS